MRTNKHAAAVDAWWDLPELLTLGGFVHRAWHDPAMYALVSRRETMRRVANELLMHLDCDECLEKGLETLPPGVIAYAEFVASNPISVKHKLIADALSGALSILAIDETLLNDSPQLGSRVYYPLFVLTGLRLNQKAIALPPRKGVTAELLEASRLGFIKKNGKERGWIKAAAIEYALDRKQITRIVNGT